jgi:hypothetical protein
MSGGNVSLPAERYFMLYHFKDSWFHEANNINLHHQRRKLSVSVDLNHVLPVVILAYRLPYDSSLLINLCMRHGSA